MKCGASLSNSWQPMANYMESFMKTLGVKLTFPEGQKCHFGSGNYRISYLLKCDPNTNGISLEILKRVSRCELVFEFLTKFSCINYAYNGTTSPIPTNSTNSSALQNDTSISYSTLISWFFGLLFVYAVGFSIYNYRTNPEDGVIKSLPHREFWSSFARNTKYGCEISYNYIKQKCNNNEN